MSDQGTPSNDHSEYPQSLASSLELSVDVSVMRELDQARLEIQRLRGKLERLRVHGSHPAPEWSQHWMLVPTLIWRDVMGETGDDAE